MVFNLLLRFVEGEVEYWATGGQGYQKSQGSVGVIDIAEPPTFAPPPSVQQSEPQPQQSENLAECPPIYIPEQFVSNMDAALDIIHDCGVWNDFCKVTIDVKHNPSAPTAQVGCSAEAVHRGIKGTRCNMEIGTEFLGFPAEDLSFAMLHEIYHELQRYAGKPYGRAIEENDCNNFADKKLKAAGYSHNFRINPDGTVTRTMIAVGFGGRKHIIQEKTYKL